MNAHCCAMMSSNLAGSETAIRYVPKFREYGIPVLDGGSSFIFIRYCPWCGTFLPGSLRDRRSKEIAARGYEVGDEDIPTARFGDRKM